MFSPYCVESRNWIAPEEGRGLWLASAVPFSDWMKTLISAEVSRQVEWGRSEGVCIILTGILQMGHFDFACESLAAVIESEWMRTYMFQHVSLRVLVLLHILTICFASPCWVNCRIRSCRKLGFISNSTLRVHSQNLSHTGVEQAKYPIEDWHWQSSFTRNSGKHIHTHAHTHTRCGVAAMSLCWQETKQTLSIMLLVSASLKVRGQWLSDKAVEFYTHREADEEEHGAVVLAQ